jgi:hypothetical protein
MRPTSHISTLLTYLLSFFPFVQGVVTVFTEDISDVWQVGIRSRIEVTGGLQHTFVDTPLRHLVSKYNLVPL